MRKNKRKEGKTFRRKEFFFEIKKVINWQLKRLPQDFEKLTLLQSSNKVLEACDRSL